MNATAPSDPAQRLKLALQRLPLVAILRGLTPAEREGLALVVEHITILNRRWNGSDGPRERSL